MKADTLWAFQMRRGASEALSAHVATMESPLRFKDEALATLDPIREPLKKFYAEHRGEKPLDILYGIEQKFGTDLLMDFCIPLGTNQGACLLAALAVASDANGLEITNDDAVVKPISVATKVSPKRR